MPRYFFNVEGSPLDQEGTEIEDLATAKCEAVSMAGKLVCDDASKFWDTDGLRMTVTDERGLILFALDFHGTVSPIIAAARP